MRTQSPCFEHRHGGFHSECAGDIAGSEHDTALIAADNHRLVLEGRRVALFDGGVECVAIDMGDFKGIDFPVAKQARRAARPATVNGVRQVAAAIAAKTRHDRPTHNIEIASGGKPHSQLRSSTKGIIPPRCERQNWKSLDAEAKSRLPEAIVSALALALWEIYFFWYAGSMQNLQGRLGLFTADRMGFNMAWLAAIYLTYQLISIPFSLPSASNRFLGVVDGMASLVPLAVVLIVVFGKPQLIETAPRWEAAMLLIFITIVDLFGGYTFNIALSRRTMDVAPVAPA
jgi:hypothetical protein